jgi:hypothetical protein
MAKLQFKGLEEYEAQLLKLRGLTEQMIGEAIYEGAAIVADEVKKGIESIPIDDRYVAGGTMLHGITQEQKQGLIDGFGIASMQNENGYLHVKLGFNGYNSMRTKNFPNGQPNSMIARSVNSGSSFRQRIPFVDNAVNSAKSRAEEKMKQKLDEAIEKAIK